MNVRTPIDGIKALLRDYRPSAMTRDELVDASGVIRPVWRQFLGFLALQSPEALAQRLARGDQYLRDAGVYFRAFGDGSTDDRAWPLSHAPVLIAADEWDGICRALAQRADLLEAVAADLYGPNELVARQLLPANLMASSPEWLRPMVGVTPAGGHFLHFLAFEIGRGPRGDWWVLGDRTQAPSGAGFALENRLATAHVFSDFYAGANVRRLAPFFRDLRDALLGLRPGGGKSAAILTPGPASDSYFEQAYIARYLGLPLLEGEDLTIADGQVMVRTVEGFQAIDALWRRLDASFADPLELNQQSQLGVPGLVGALRRGGPAIVNALGAGVLETRALLAFLPRICEALRGEPLAMPNIATWWCGQEDARDYVAANAARMVLAPAHSTKLPFEVEGGILPSGPARAFLPDTLRWSLGEHGDRLVAQEAVSLSTAPAFTADGRLEARPISVRVFLARTPNGWAAMPGGYARVGQSHETEAISLRSGGAVADVWIVSETPVERNITMIAAPGGSRAHAPPLPSRAADNLFWLGRYTERAEHTLRLARAFHVRISEGGDPEHPLLRLIASCIGPDCADSAAPDGLGATLSSAVACAGRIRDRFSVDGWLALNDLIAGVRPLAATPPGHEAARAHTRMLRQVAAFSGLVHDSMVRTTGWRFMLIGRSLERASQMAFALEQFCDPDAPDGALEAAIEIGDSVITHRARYAMAISAQIVHEMLALDRQNPRSLMFCAAEISEHVAALPRALIDGAPSAPMRAASAFEAGLAAHSPATINAAALDSFAAAAASLSDILSAEYWR